MTITKNVARKGQYIAEVAIGKTDMVTTVEQDIIDMPAGSVLDDCYLAVDALFDPTATAVFEAGIAGSTAKFIASQNIFTGQALGGRAGAATGKGYRFTAAGAIRAKYTSGGGLATAGQLRVIAVYHYENDCDFVMRDGTGPL